MDKYGKKEEKNKQHKNKEATALKFSTQIKLINFKITQLIKNTKQNNQDLEEVEAIVSPQNDDFHCFILTVNRNFLT